MKVKVIKSVNPKSSEKSQYIFRIHFCQLSDLYDLMEESSGTIQALPELTARLNSLRDLHQNAAEIVKELADVKSLQEAIANGTIENDRQLKDLQGVLNETLKHVK